MTIGQMDFWVDQASNDQEPMTPKPCLVSPPSVERERLYRKQRKA
jgi:hypothetical protein